MPTPRSHRQATDDIERDARSGDPFLNPYSTPIPLGARPRNITGGGDFRIGAISY